MFILALGLTVFFGLHLLPSFVELRSNIITRLGKGAYKGLFSVISLSGLILIVIGKSMADFQPLWEPPIWNKNVVMGLMLLSFIFLASANMPSNIKRFTCHPMLWGSTLWSGAHLLANGDLASLMLFGAFGVFSLFDMISENMRGAAKQETKYPFTKDVIVIVAGIVIYGALLFLHPYLFNVSII